MTSLRLSTQTYIDISAAFSHTIISDGNIYSTLTVYINVGDRMVVTKSEVIITIHTLPHVVY